MTDIQTILQNLLQNKYEVIRKIGSGGMGEVFLGHHKALERPVAIKTLNIRCSQDPSLIDRFRQEASLAANLDHPGIIDIYDFGSSDRFNYIIMAYIEGQTLKQKLKQDGIPDLSACLAMMIEMTAALAYAHQNHVVHRDVKPANFMISSSGSIVLTDFGISKNLDQPDLTLDNRILGSPKYMSPEQITGDSIDARADGYALGLVFYEMLTGMHPFEGKNSTTVLHCQLHECPPPLSICQPNLPAPLSQIVMRLLNKAPEERYADCAELLLDLQRCHDLLAPLGREDADATWVDEEATVIDEPAATEPKANKSSALSEGKRHFNRLHMYGITTLLVVALIGAATFFWWHRQKTPNAMNANSISEAISPVVAKTNSKFTDYPQLVERLFADDSLFMPLSAIELGANKQRFATGDAMRFHFKIPFPSDVWIIYLNTTGELIQLYPNQFQPNALVNADTLYHIPPTSELIELAAAGPAGKEKLVLLLANVTNGTVFSFNREQPFGVIEPTDEQRIKRLHAYLDQLQSLGLRGKMATFTLQ